MSEQLRICVVGDELAAGVGDPKGLGWVGRVVARTRPPEPPQVLTLAVPGETTTELAGRWEEETSRRFAAAGRGARPGEPRFDDRIVVGLGRADLTAGTSLARSRLNLANLLDVAAGRTIPALVVGPPPGRPEDGERLAELSAAFADVAGRRRVPYVETYAPLAQHEQWLADLASGDGRLPSQAGYGLMAWLVLHTGWHGWLGLPDDGA